MIPSLGFLRPTPCGGLPVELGGRSRMRESPEELRDRVYLEVSRVSTECRTICSGGTDSGIATSR